jgi:hypothetical protein
VKLVVDCRGPVPLLKNERDGWELTGGKLEIGEAPRKRCAGRSPKNSA